MPYLPPSNKILRVELWDAQRQRISITIHEETLQQLAKCAAMFSMNPDAESAASANQGPQQYPVHVVKIATSTEGS